MIKAGAKTEKTSGGRFNNWRETAPDQQQNLNASGPMVESSRIPELNPTRSFTWEWNFTAGTVARNGSAEKLLGAGSVKMEDFISRIHPDDQEIVRDKLQKALCGIEDYSAEFRYLHPMGKTLKLRDSAQIRKNEAGEAESLYGVCLDVTQESNDPLHLQDTEEKFKATFDQAAVGIAFANLHGVLLEVNSKFAEILQYSPDELVGQTVTDFTFPDDISQTLRNMSGLLNGEFQHYIHEKRYIQKAGGVIWSRTTVSLIKDARGIPQYCIGVIEDISSQKAAENELTCLKNRLASDLEDTRRLHQLSTRLLSHKDLNQSLMEVLRASIELTGTDRGNIQLFDEGNNCLNIVVHSGFSPEFLQEFQSVPYGYSVCGKALESKSRILVENAFEDPRFSDLAPLYQKFGFVSVQSTPLIGSDGRFLGMLSTHFEKPHRCCERELQLLDLFAQQAVRVIEHKREEEIGRRLFDLAAAVNRASNLEDIYSPSLEAICTCYQANRASILLYDSDRVMRFKAWRGLSDNYRKAVEGHSPWKPDDANPKPVAVSDINKIELDPGLRKVIQDEGIGSLAFIPIVNDKHLLGKFMIYYSAAHNFSPAEIGLAETISSQIAFAIERHQSGEALERLVTDRTRSLQEVLQQMEEFSYTVSHDLRAPLRAMQGYSTALMEDYGNSIGAEGHHYLKRLSENCQRLDKMILDILRFSRIARAQLTLETINLEKLVRDLVDHYAAIQNSGAKIQIDIQHKVHAHEPSLVQVISNLLTNSIKFVEKGVQPRIRIWTEEIWTEEINSDIRICVQDNGIGIAPEHQHRLFNMFERLHPCGEYEGTGVGLAIVRKAVERMGGTVGVKSEGAAGSCFWVQLRAPLNH